MTKELLTPEEITEYLDAYLEEVGWVISKDSIQYAWLRQLIRRVAQLAKSQEACQLCDGDGWVLDQYQEQYPCPTCRGTGKRTTPCEFEDWDDTTLPHPVCHCSKREGVDCANVPDDVEQCPDYKPKTGTGNRLDRPELREKIAEWLYGTPWAWSSELKHETRTYWYTRADQILAICEEEIRKQERERIEQIADMEGGIITFKRTSVEDCILIRKADWQALKGE